MNTIKIYKLVMLLMTNNQVVSKDLDFNDLLACKNAKQELQMSFTTYGQAQSNVEILYGECMDMSVGAIN